MSELRAYDQRAAAIGYKLATAARPYCLRTAPSLGLTIDAIERYEPTDRLQADSELGLSEAVQVSGIAAGGPGDISGLKIGDEILSIAGEPLPLVSMTSPSHARVGAVYEAIEHAAPGGIELRVKRGTTHWTVHTTPDVGCDVHLVVSTRTSSITFTDGHDIDVPVGLFRFAASDNEAAFAVAHEVAHAIFKQHGEAPRTLKGKRNLELRADSLAVGLMAEAGFDPQGALQFWTRFASRDTFGFLRFPDHPSTKRRLEYAQSHVTRLRAGSSPADLIVEALQAQLGRSISMPLSE